MQNGNDATLLNDLINGKISLEDLKTQLSEAVPYLAVGKNYKELKFKGFARIGDTAVNVYEAGEKVNNAGTKVEAKPRAAKTTGPKRK